MRVKMIAPWKNWCRLCANPNGSLPIHLSGDGHLLAEKIRKYLSISVSAEDKGASLLCNKCCEQLANFDRFVNHCLQVQAMFGALYELVDDNVADDRLSQIRKEFLPSDFEVNREKTFDGGVSPNISPNVKKRTVLEKELSLCKIKREASDKRPMLCTIKQNGCEEKQFSESLPNDYPKNGRIKSMTELRQAFDDENEILTDSLDSDFNEESFENLLDNDDAFQRVLRNSSSEFKMKDISKPNQNSFSNAEIKQEVHMASAGGVTSEKISDKEKIPLNNPSNRKQEPDTGIVCDLSVLSSNVNSTCMNSLSDSDINDFMCDETDDDETPVNLGNHHENKELRINGVWKNQEENKVKGSLKNPSNEHQKIYQLEEMFVEDGNDQDCTVHTDWNIDKISNDKVAGRKKPKTKEQNIFMCDKCDKIFPRKSLLESHLISHMPKDQQPYVCCKCARRFHCEALLKNHERVHLPNEEKRVYPCHVCSKKFSRRSAVTAHMKAIHYGERPFVCHMCGNTFSSKAILQEHMTIHSDEEPWECNKCNKKFKTKYRLKIHMDTHRETPYSCPHCPLQLSTRRTLRMHLVVHRDTKAYQCATCGKAFRRAKDLKNHQNLHTGRRPYTCPFCSRTFANGSNCRSHKRRMHPEELRLYEATLAANGSTDIINNSTPLELNAGNAGNLVSQDMDEEGTLSMKEDSQDSLLTEMALDLQQPQMPSEKSGLTSVNEDPVVTAADLTLAPLVTLSAALPKLEPEDSRLVVMNLTTQIHDTHDSMEAMSPLNLNIMSPMNLNISSPLNLNISSPLNLNISSVLHSPTGRNQQQHHQQSQHHQSQSRYQQPHQSQQQPQHLTLQPALHHSHQLMPQNHQQFNHLPQVHHQMHQQQVTRSSLQVSNLQTSLSSSTQVHTLPVQTQLPAHINNTVHHAPQIQTFIPLNQQGTLYSHHTTQDSVSSAALVAAAAVAHSMATSSSTTLPPFSGSPYVQHSMAYSRSSNM